jgi:sarcosine oxidase subunit beta
MVDAAELRRLVPAIAPHCVGALVVRTDGAADPYRTTMAFARQARARGVDIVEGECVLGLEREREAWLVVGSVSRYRAPLVVNAAGAWAARVAAMVGEVLPLKTRASMMIVTERMPSFVKPVLGSAGRKLSFKQTPAGTVLIGGGQQGRADLEREESWVDVGNLAHAAAAAAALFPLMRDAAIVRAWSGIEAETPDAIPVIGWSRAAPALIHVFGFSGHGFQLGPICGRAVADLATAGRTDLQIDALGVERFARSAAVA